MPSTYARQRLVVSRPETLTEADGARLHDKEVRPKKEGIDYCVPMGLALLSGSGAGDLRRGGGAGTLPRTGRAGQPIASKPQLDGIWLL